MALHVIRDRQTKEMRAMWAPPQTARELEAYRLGRWVAPDIDLAEHEEYVLLAHFELSTVMEVAENKVREKRLASGLPVTDDELYQPGKVRVFDNEVDADPPVPRPTLADQIRKVRESKNKALDTPVTLEEIEAAERAINGN